MVTSDLIILVPMQRIKTKFHSNKTQCICDNNSVLRSRKRMQWEYKIFDWIVGMLYTLYPSDDLFADHQFFDVQAEHNGEDFYDYDCLVVIEEGWKETVTDIIDFYLEKSPSGVIGVLFRLDYPTQEQVEGVYSRDAFIENLEAGKLYFDREYFVSKQGN